MSDKKSSAHSVTYRIGNAEITVDRFFTGGQTVADALYRLTEERLQSGGPTAAASRAEEPG